MNDMDTVLQKLRRADRQEAIAVTRLRRAQTLFDKAYARRKRYEDQHFALVDIVNRVTARLTGKKDGTK